MAQCWVQRSFSLIVTVSITVLPIWNVLALHLVAADIPFELLALYLVPPAEQPCSYAALLVYLADHSIVYSVEDPGHTCRRAGYAITKAPESLLQQPSAIGPLS